MPVPSQTITTQDEVFLNFIEQMYHLTGYLPTAEKCAEYGFDITWYRKLQRRQTYRANLIQRGIRGDVIDQVQGSARDRGILTEEQLTAVNVILDLRDNRSTRKKLSELGITTNKWDTWLKDPAFQNYLKQRAENLLGDNQYEAHYALLSKVRAGDVSAIKYFNELTGRYVPVSSTNNGSNLDIKLLLTRVIEAIQKHVTDPDTQAAIAQEILGYAQVQGFVNQAIAPINIPAPVGMVPERRVIYDDPVPINPEPVKELPHSLQSLSAGL